VIELKNLRKEFDDLTAVDDLTLTIPQGEIYGLIGPNGAGKTTTIRMSCGLLAPTQGSARVADVDVLSQPEHALTFIGYLSDFFSVYEDLKVWEYLDYFAHAYKMPEGQIPGRITEVVAQVGLEVKRDALIRGLSRGMKQRLDEPASGLDPKARFDLRSLLRSLRDQGATILISSHILTELEGFCTSIGIMEKGRLVRSGRIEDVTSAESTARTLRLRWMGDSMATIGNILSTQAKVSGVILGKKDSDANEGNFQFSGSDDELVQMLADLVAAGVRVLAFTEVKQTVEDLYMKLARHEVM
jgi:ABC-2 type transport system ATP-binding protein